MTEMMFGVPENGVCPNLWPFWLGQLYPSCFQTQPWQELRPRLLVLAMPLGTQFQLLIIFDLKQILSSQKHIMYHYVYMSRSQGAINIIKIRRSALIRSKFPVECCCRRSLLCVREPGLESADLRVRGNSGCELPYDVRIKVINYGWL